MRVCVKNLFQGVVGKIWPFAPDPWLVDPDSDWKSSWLLKNCVVIRLEPGETFYQRREGPPPILENTASLFAQTVKRRRCEQAQS